MKRNSIGAATLAVALALGLAGVARPQAVPKPAAAPKAVATPKPAPVQEPLFKPGFDDLMTMLVQPRHAKLHYSGAAKNWELAASQSRGLRQALARIAQTIPKYQGIDVDEAVQAIMAPNLQAVDAAIAAADPQQFTAAYAELTSSCNTCHAYMERPFLVVKIPDAPPNLVYPDQDFSANP